MRILVDPDALVKAGIVTSEQADAMRAQARGALATAGINAALFAGIFAVIAGAVGLLEDPDEIAAFGAVVTALGAIGLLRGGEVIRMPANAAAVIGTVMAGGGVMVLALDAWEAPRTLIWLGLAFAGPGLLLRLRGPTALRFLAAWAVALGVAMHLCGVLYGLGGSFPPWLIWHYAFALLLVSGIGLDARILTALAMVPLVGSISVETYETRYDFDPTVGEVTLTLIQMAIVAAIAWLAAARSSERVAVHLRLLALLCVIWANVAFWVGSIWDDTVGDTLWAPVQSGFLGADGEVDRAAWRAALEAWEAQAVTIPREVFAGLWAVLLVGVGLWSALTSQRGLFNVAATFGAIHFFTQYFERLGSSPQAFIAAGLIAIALAWGAWAMNRRLGATGEDG